MIDFDIAQEVLRQKTNLLFRNLLNGIVVTAIVATVYSLAVAFGLLLGPPDGLVFLSSWLVGTYLVLLFRLRLLRQYKTANPTLDELPKWRTRFRFFAALSGLCWGCIGLIEAFAPLETQSFTLLIVGAMAVSAIPYLAADSRSYNLYLFFSIAPIAVASLLVRSGTSMLTFSFVVVYAFGIWRSAKHYTDILTSSLELRISGDRLSNELAAANEQLESELKHRKEVARQLQHARNTAESANRAKTVFLSRMSHELRTPLNAVLGFSELMSIMSLAELVEKKTEYLQKIKSSGSHLLSLIEDILDITKIDDGNIRLHEQDIDISEVIAECLTMLEPEIGASSVEVVLDQSSDSSLSISSDRLRFRQIILNLLSNAIKYNKRNGRVDIRYYESGPTKVCIEVADTGIGIAEADLENAFQPFVRLASDAKTIEGTGIGLTITKQLTEMMGGTISVESVVDEGTRITIELPRSIGDTENLQDTGT